MNVHRHGSSTLTGALAIVGMFTALCAAASISGASAGATRIMGAWVIAVGVVVVSPRAIEATKRWFRTMPRPIDWQLETVLGSLAYLGPIYLPFPPPAGQPDSDDELLSRAWCASLNELETARSRRKVMRIVAERREYLDELERREPAAFAGWLASATSADGSPLTSLTAGRTAPSSIDWDKLLDGQDNR